MYSILFGAVSALITTAVSAPISTAVFETESVAVNVIGLSASAEYGMWVPTDGEWYLTSAIGCLNIGASAWTSCDSPIFNQVGVVSGYSCAFSGTTWSGSEVGTSSSGFIQVGPPESLLYVACVAN